MTTYTGMLGKIESGANAVGEVKGFEISQSSETQDDTVMGDVWRTKKAMHKMWSGSIDALLDNADTGQNDFTVGSTITFKGYPSEDAVSNLELSGSCIVTERTIRTSFDGLCEISISVEGTGALVETTL